MSRKRINNEGGFRRQFKKLLISAPENNFNDLIRHKTGFTSVPKDKRQLVPTIFSPILNKSRRPNANRMKKWSKIVDGASRDGGGNRGWNPRQEQVRETSGQRAKNDRTQLLIRRRSTVRREGKGLGGCERDGVRSRGWRGGAAGAKCGGNGWSRARLPDAGRRRRFEVGCKPNGDQNTF